MMKLLLLAAALSLSACATVPSLPASPATVADKTLLDEKVGTLATNTYTAAATAAKFSIQLGLIRDPAMIRQIGVLDNRAFAAVEALRGAYLSGNATTYAAAIDRANGAVTAFVAAVKGEK